MDVTEWPFVTPALSVITFSQDHFRVCREDGPGSNVNGRLQLQILSLVMSRQLRLYISCLSTDSVRGRTLHISCPGGWFKLQEHKFIMLKNAILSNPQFSPTKTSMSKSKTQLLLLFRCILNVNYDVKKRQKYTNL